MNNQVFGDEHKSTIDKLVAGCRFEPWSDDVYIDYTDNVHLNNFAEKLEVDVQSHIIAVGRGAWEDGYLDDDFVAYGKQCLQLAERPEYDSEDVFLVAARNYLESIKETKRHV